MRPCICSTVVAPIAGARPAHQMWQEQRDATGVCRLLEPIGQTDQRRFAEGTAMPFLTSPRRLAATGYDW